MSHRRKHTGVGVHKIEAGVVRLYCRGKGEWGGLRGQPVCYGDRKQGGVGGSRDHLSATAAAIGTRMVPRAVAANSSISVFSRLMTHSIASRP